MEVKLFELVKEEAGALIPKYELRGFKEFKEIIKKPEIGFIGYNNRVLSKEIMCFVKEKSLEYFNHLLKEYKKPTYSPEYSMELKDIKNNFKINIKKSGVASLFPEEAINLMSKVRNLPSTEYMTWNIGKINEDLMKIYNQS